MESFDFVESGIVFGLDTSKAIKEFRHPPKDFAVHGDAYKFVVNSLMSMERYLQQMYYRKIFLH